MSSSDELLIIISLYGEEGFLLLPGGRHLSFPESTKQKLGGIFRYAQQGG